MRRAVAAPRARRSEAPGCLVLDEDVFARMIDGEDDPVLGRLGMPVVLLVGTLTRRLLDRARAAGVAQVVEKPLLGGVLLEAISKVIGAKGRPSLGEDLAGLGGSSRNRRLRSSP